MAGRSLMETSYGLRAAGQQAHQRRLTGRCLNDAAAFALAARVQEVIGQSNHFAQPIHHNGFQLSACR